MQSSTRALFYALWVKSNNGVCRNYATEILWNRSSLRNFEWRTEDSVSRPSVLVSLGKIGKNFYNDSTLRSLVCPGDKRDPG